MKRNTWETERDIIQLLKRDLPRMSEVIVIILLSNNVWHGWIMCIAKASNTKSIVIMLILFQSSSDIYDDSHNCTMLPDL